jgi:copper resistance protein B
MQEVAAVLLLLGTTATSALAQPAHDHHTHHDHHDHAEHAARPVTTAPVQHGDHMMGAHYTGKLLLDKLEASDSDSQHWDAQAWVSQPWGGGDIHKLWLKAEGEREEGHTEHAEVQALYSRAISPFFDAQIGLRRDLQPHPTRDWLAVGLQGLAPYFFETEATLFVGDEGRSALRLKAEYDLLFTQRLILSPEIELDAYGEDDPELGLGSGLSNLEFGLRLRYEIRREFAPYIGVVWSHQFGDTADYTRANGGDMQDVQWVAGVKFWL